MRSALRHTVLFALGLAGASIAVELGLRAVSATPLWRLLPVPEVALYGPDPHAGVGHRPGVSGIWLQENRARIRTSSLGLRDRERPLAPAAHPRAVVTGNSYIEALQVDQADTAVAVAERLLAARLGGAEVFNLGLAGATPAAQMARLKSVGLALKPDVAVLVLPVHEFFSGLTRDDMAFAGYRRQPDGRYALSRGFLKTGGYRFRTSAYGRFTYWLLDHLAVARVLNSRKNVGLFAEWPKLSPRKGGGEADDDDCRELIPRQLALWGEGRRPGVAAGILDAFLRDLREVHERGVQVVLVLSNIPTGCPGGKEVRKRLMDEIAGRLPGFVRTVDLYARLRDRHGQDWRTRLKGFGARIGHGHLNVEGNRAYGEIMAEAIEAAWRARR